jgi:hypothetical protein
MASAHGLALGPFLFWAEHLILERTLPVLTEPECRRNNHRTHPVTAALSSEACC